MLKKIKKLQLFRHIVQLISFFLFPGFFILAFGELKYIYQLLIKGDINILQTLSGSVELILVILFTVIFGRFFCGWICAFGTYNDLVYKISKKVFKTKFRISKGLDSKLKYLKYAILLLIIVFSWTIGYSFFEYSSPWEAFAQIPDISLVISSFAIGLFLLLLITAGAAFIERFFCRYLCPLGAVFSVLSKLSIFNIDMPKYDCTNRNCRACTGHCSMGIPLYDKNEISGGECINCLNCIQICPSKNAKATIMRIRISSAVAVSIALAVVIGFYGFYNIGLSASALASNDAASKSSVGSNNSTKSIVQDNGISTDSNIAASSNTPTNSDNRTNEDRKNSASSTNQNKASNSNTAANASNSTNTKASSNTSAKTKSNASASTKTNSTAGTNTKANSNTSSSTKTTSSTSTSTKPASNTSSNTSKNTTNNTTSSSTKTQTTKYKDGTYTGSGMGFRGGTTTVSITISNDKIISMETVSSEDTPRFYERVESTIFDEILSAQSTSVDTVSGATYSSDGIKSAVEDALSKALINP